MPVAWVLAVSGLFGFAIGFAYADWQVAVETAQVIAGIVRYPAGNPFYIYHMKIWTVLNQICAVVLLTGVSEIALSKILSGVLGMITFQGWALIVYALSRDVWLAIGSTFVIFLSRAAQFGIVYPIFLVDTSDTYGVVGLAVLVLVAGFVGCEWYRTGAFLVGAAPAIHPSLGLWLVVIVAASVIVRLTGLRQGYGGPPKRFARRRKPEATKNQPEATKSTLRWLLAGCAVTVASLVVELILVYDVPPVDPAFARRFFLAFVTFWDGHRQPVHMKTIGVAFNLGALGLSVIWLRFFADDLPRGARALLRFVAVCVALSVALGFVSWIPPERVPTWFLVLMPARLLNVNALVFPALLIGLIGAYRDRVWSQAIVIALSLRLLLSSRSLVWAWLEREGSDTPGVQIALFWSIAAVSVLLVCCVAATKNVSSWLPASAFARSASAFAEAAADRRSLGGGWSANRRSLGGGRSAGRSAAWLRVATLALCAGAGVVSWGLAARHVQADRATKFRDRTNDALFASIARGQGVLLTAGDLHLIQLRTRRPVLLDGGGLDGVAYALEASGAMDRIMREAYGVDPFHPPEEARGGGRMPPNANRSAWEGFSSDRWRTIARTYGVTQVLAFADWTLALRPVAHSRRFTLYAMPD